MDGSKSKFSLYTFTELRELYEKNPLAFTELADDAIRHACTGRTPERTLRLKQLQWTIDMQLRKAKTPLRRMQVMEGIFYDQVFGDRGNLHQLRSGWTEVVRAAHGGGNGPRCRPVLRVAKK